MCIPEEQPVLTHTLPYERLKAAQPNTQQPQSLPTKEEMKERRKQQMIKALKQEVQELQWKVRLQKRKERLLYQEIIRSQSKVRWDPETEDYYVEKPPLPDFMVGKGKGKGKGKQKAGEFEEFEEFDDEEDDPYETDEDRRARLVWEAAYERQLVEAERARAKAEEQEQFVIREILAQETRIADMEDHHKRLLRRDFGDVEGAESTQRWSPSLDIDDL